MRTTVYRRLRHYNSWIMAVLGTLAVLAVITALVVTVVRPWQRHNRLDNRIATQERLAVPTPVVTDSERIAGTPWLALKLGDRSAFAGGSWDSGSESGASEEVNVLLINMQSGSSRFVLADNSRRVVIWQVLSSTTGDSISRDGASADAGGARAYVVLVGDRHPSATPRYDILIGNLMTGREAWVAKGVTAMDAPEIIEGKSVGLLTWDGQRPTYRRYNLDSLRQELSRPIPALSGPHLVNAPGNESRTNR